MMSNLTHALVDLHPVPDALLKLTVVLLTAWGISLCLRSRNPRWRVLLWRISITGALSIPVLLLLAPAWEFPVTPPAAGAASALRGGFLNGYGGLFPVPMDSVFIGDLTSVSPLDKRGVASFLPEELNPYPLIAATWVLGFLVMSAIVFRSQRRALLILRNSSAPSPEAVRLLRRVAAELGIPGRIPILRLSPVLFSPFLIGVRRPVVVLPSWLAEDERQDDLSAVLGHELSHLKGNDVLWLGVINVLTCLLWWHPLVWMARRAHTDACEELADAVAAGHVGDNELYSGALARVALQAGGHPPLSTAVPMARRSRMIRRLNNLKRVVLTSDLGYTRTAVALIAGGVFLCTICGCRFGHALDAQIGESPQTSGTPGVQVPGREPESLTLTTELQTFEAHKSDVEATLEVRDPADGIDVIVDNDDKAPAYVETGRWRRSVIARGHEGGSYRFTTYPEASATWTVSLKQTGNYNVQVFYIAGKNRSTSVKYDIAAASGKHSVFIDQQVNDSGWISLGVFPFNAGDNTVTLDALGSSVSRGKIAAIADAVRFTLNDGSGTGRVAGSNVDNPTE